MFNQNIIDNYWEKHKQILESFECYKHKNHIGIKSGYKVTDEKIILQIFLYDDTEILVEKYLVNYKNGLKILNDDFLKMSLHTMLLWANKELESKEVQYEKYKQYKELQVSLSKKDLTIKGVKI